MPIDVRPLEMLAASTAPNDLRFGQELAGRAVDSALKRAAVGRRVDHAPVFI